MFDRKKLKDFMSDNNLAVSKVAAEFGVTESAIRNILYGIKQPSLAMANGFAKMMDCKVDDLVIDEK